MTPTEQLLREIKERLDAGHIANAPPELAKLIEIVEVLREGLNTFKEIGDMGPEDTVMTFVEDPSVIEYAQIALAKADAIAGKGDE